MRGFLILVAVLVVVGLAWSLTRNAPSSFSTTVLSARQIDLRDEAIQNIGWLAGNARGHPIWPQVEPFVGEGGQYYDAFLRISSGRYSDELEASMNVQLYRQWRERGAALPFNERDSTSRIQRVIAIAREMF